MKYHRIRKIISGIADLYEIQQSWVKRLLPVSQVKGHPPAAARDWLAVRVMKLHWTNDHTPFLTATGHNKRQGQKFIAQYAKRCAVKHSFVPAEGVALSDTGCFTGHPEPSRLASAANSSAQLSLFNVMSTLPCMFCPFNAANDWKRCTGSSTGTQPVSFWLFRNHVVWLVGLVQHSARVAHVNSSSVKCHNSFIRQVTKRRWNTSKPELLMYNMQWQLYIVVYHH